MVLQMIWILLGSVKNGKAWWALPDSRWQGYVNKESFKWTEVLCWISTSSIRYSLRSLEMKLS
ncbi:hypothetical protein CS542_08040 [Pedobacter sp. IW39]|nr:hypothetical protein CS542_08040 [Pedobacter sp. IW39]